MTAKHNIIVNSSNNGYKIFQRLTIKVCDFLIWFDGKIVYKFINRKENMEHRSQLKGQFSKSYRTLKRVVQ